ncbi:AAA family ATPase [Mucilaginibacter aquariorum]|uniref:AAA family ATPase n=1 Tax=Mucilaginibacter aquariorum TaxID=2967225 RepID=A0ABT1T150_9SPHI|nr:ATP-binding protein [Mucilaginibacter aquariorum]MCQ6958299.1 AAA family ATPase [Mucilaginibacter aquariorum]
MKIKQLWVSNYKNIVDITLEFKADNITLLVGQNGLGKSNLLEILAIIFTNLDLLEAESDYNDWPYDTDNFEYDISYECKGADIRINSMEGMFKVFKKGIEQPGDLQVINFDDFKKSKQQFFLPDHIIGYYSGENKRIKSIIQNHEKKVLSDLKTNKGLDNGFRRVFFSENHHGQLILLTLLLYADPNKEDNFNEAVESLIENFSSFSELEEFGLQLKNPPWYNSNNKNHRERGIDELEQNIIKADEFPFWNAKGKANKMLRYLYDRNIAELIYYNEKEFFDQPYEIIELNNIDKELIAENLLITFEYPLDFFDALESLELINVISSIHLNVKAKQDETTFDFRQLSEGEQQLVTVLGLLLIVGKGDCLFLLDEPDTHLNPTWQRDYVKLLKQFNLNGLNSHIILATHSPLIVQAAEDADIFLYKRNQEGKIEILNNRDLKIHNWRIDQVLGSEFFGFQNTRPPQLDEFMAERERLLSKSELTKEDIESIRDMEEGGGILPSGETLNDFQAMHLVRTIAQQIRNDQNQ